MAIVKLYPVSESEVDFHWEPAGKQCKTWYKVVGDLATATQPAVIVLHGGPGAGHEYLIPLAELWETHGIPVVLYDQVGCARSTRFPEKLGDGDFWSFDLFIAELDNLIDHLGLRAPLGFSLVGQSWGGMLGAEYASRHPPGLHKFVNAGGPASFPLMAEGEKPMLAALPDDVRKTIEDCLAKEDYESEAFEEASGVFYARHFCCLDPFPDEVQECFGHLKEDPTVYKTMTGPCEFVLTGSLESWDGGRDVAHKIEVDTLLINGQYDEVSDLCMEPWFANIPRVRWVTLSDASHMSHHEQGERFLKLCADFLFVKSDKT
ncbi:proline-specific peptidase [Thozetella sp. PMI_491]|nr:proline-specific peptidase [Thozetella sp. PMI_491]